MNPKITPKATLDREYVHRTLRECALLERLAQEYYDEPTWYHPSNTRYIDIPDRLSRDYRYRRLYRKANVLNDEVERHIYQYTAQECRSLCDAMHDALPRELRDIIYDLLFDAMRPPIEDVPNALDAWDSLKTMAPARSDRQNAHVGDVACVGQRTLYELAQEWSRRSPIFVAQGWQGICLADYGSWDYRHVVEQEKRYIILQTTYPVAKHGQDFSSLESDVAVLRQLGGPLNILIDWDTNAILHDKIRNADADMIGYFENIVQIYPLLRYLLESGNGVSMAFMGNKRPFLVDSVDLVDKALVSKAYKARCVIQDGSSAPDMVWYGKNWMCGSVVYLPRVLHGLCQTLSWPQYTTASVT